ncbi:MAG: FxLYD domain-containing protein, partial [Candidatus Bathyarchaeota archaeon]|nr:FxLYD domain-containing protein [Candidatus Bathyarchaeota archaeon]
MFSRLASFTPLLPFLILLVPVIALSVYPALAAGQVSGRAELVSHSYFIGYLKLEAADETIEGNFYNIVGLVENTGTVSIEHVSIIPTLYDAKGEVIVVSSEILHLWCPERLENDTRQPVNLIAPGERLPLKVTILDEEAGRRIASYDLSIDFDETTREPYGDVQVLGTNLYVDEWYAYLTGEMKNVGTKNTYYDVFFALYDETGRIVDAGYYAGLTSILVPEQKSPFEIQVWPLHDITPPIRIESYELFPQCMETTVESYEEFEVLSHTSYVGSYPPIIERGMIVEGEIKNVGSRDATGVGVIATFYDAEGRVVGVSHDGWMVDRNLRAGEVDSFKLVPMTGEEWYGKVASYILQVTCHEYVLPSSISCGVSKPEVILGEQVVVSGSTSFRRGGVTVTLRYVKPDGSTLTRSVATSEDGSYVDAYAPDVLGEWGVEASWGGDEYNLGATSQSLVFNVEVSDLVEKKEVQKGLVVRQVPPPEIVSASIVAGAGVAVGVPALMSFSGFARHL